MIEQIKTLIRGVVILTIIISTAWVLALVAKTYPWVFGGAIFLGISYWVGSWMN